MAGEKPSANASRPVLGEKNFDRIILNIIFGC